MPFFVPQSTIDRLLDKIDEKDRQLERLTTEVLRLRLRPVEVGGHAFVPAPDATLPEEIEAKRLPSEVEAFAEDFDSEEARDRIKSQAYEMRSLGVSDEDLLRYLIENRETHEVV